MGPEPRIPQAVSDEPATATNDASTTSLIPIVVFTLWALSTILGLVTLAIWYDLAAGLVFQLGQGLYAVVNEVTVYTIVYALGFILGGLSSGLAQGALLRRQGFHDLPWMRACGLGWGIVGLMLPLYSVIFGTRSPVPALQLALLLCAVIVSGLIQWSVLRKRIKNAFWWVIASSLGWLAAWIILAFPQVMPSGELFTILLVLLLPGMITGLAAAWLCRQSNTIPASKGLHL
jgi:hypothetical protein